MDISLLFRDDDLQSVYGNQIDRHGESNQSQKQAINTAWLESQFSIPAQPIGNTL
jgi:hypothetical protein